MFYFQSYLTLFLEWNKYSKQAISRALCYLTGDKSACIGKKMRTCWPGFHHPRGEKKMWRCENSGPSSLRCDWSLPRKPGFCSIHAFPLIRSTSKRQATVWSGWWLLGPARCQPGLGPGSPFCSVGFFASKTQMITYNKGGLPEQVTENCIQTLSPGLWELNAA